MLYRLDSVSKSFGPHDVLRDVSWQHNPGERVGLVGRNGAGKTTLFRLITGQEEPDHGEVVRIGSLKIGYLRQHLEAPKGTTLFDFVLTAFEDVLHIEEKMRTIEHALGEAGEDEHGPLLDKYAKLQHEYEVHDGYRIHAEVERVLSGIGFGEQDWLRPVHEMSGGQQNRGMLARLLLSKVDVLLLDEPTNHLDLKGIEFLEEFLESFTGSFLLISHDRTFLSRAVDKIVELAHGELNEYPGDYKKFLTLRAERMAQMQAAWEGQQELIDKTKYFIRKNLAGQKTKQAQSRRKMLEKMELVERPETDETLAVFRLDGGARSGLVTITTEALTVGYDEAVVEGVDIEIRRGQRWAIMGPNGSGKSTLLKTLAGRLAPLSGSVKIGHNARAGYYDQTLGDLRGEKRVLDEIWDLDHSKTEEQIRSYLARFSFSGEDTFKKVSALSGGEKGRLALAKIIYVGGNLLLLDEPTNHLDIYTREALEEALEGFTGALVVVSHDRYFVDRLADHIIVVEDGEAEVHLGNYTEVTERLRKEADQETKARNGSAPPKPAPVDREEKRQRERRLRRVEEEIAALEKRIAELEQACEEDDRLLCDPSVYGDGERVKELRSASAVRKTEIESLYAKWEQLGREKERV